LDQNNEILIKDLIIRGNLNQKKKHMIH